MTADEIAKDIVDAVLQVHRTWGPRLLESAYQALLRDGIQRVARNHSGRTGGRIGSGG